MREKRLAEIDLMSVRVAAVLAEFGVADVDKVELTALARNVYGELEYAIGMSLSSGLSEGLMDEFQRYIDTGDDDGTTAFLQREVPDYLDVTARLLDESMGRLRATLAARFPGGAR